MARPRAFDQDQVLTLAMEAFRRDGYAGLSIKALEAATGIKAGSIYNSFGDKAGLFAAAFAHYVEHVLEARITDHASESAGLDGLRSLFISLLHEPGDGSLGCLITNSAIEFGATDHATAPVRAALGGLSAAIEARVTVVRGDLDSVLTAIKLLALYQGILVLVRAGWSKPALEAMVNHEFDQLEGNHYDP